MNEKIFESYEEAKDYYERRKDSTMTYQSKKTLKIWSRVVTSWKEIQA